MRTKESRRVNTQGHACYLNTHTYVAMRTTQTDCNYDVKRLQCDKYYEYGLPFFTLARHMKHRPLFAWTAFSPGAPSPAGVAVLAGARGEDVDVAGCDGCAGAGATAGCAVGGVTGATAGVVGGETAAGANCVRGIVGWVIF
jgi:hypothetical protein